MIPVNGPSMWLKNSLNTMKHIKTLFLINLNTALQVRIMASFPKFIIRKDSIIAETIFQAFSKTLGEPDSVAFL